MENKSQLEANTLKKNVKQDEVDDAGKKAWKLKSLDGKSVRMRPWFQKTDQGDVECQTINFQVEVEGETHEFTIAYLELMMFCMMIGNEEHRRKLLLIKEKQVRRLPYNVDIKLSKQEREVGFCKRQLEITIDEIIAAYCQHEAVKWNIKKQQKS